MRLGVGLLWLLHWLPLPVLGALGRALGLLGYALAHKRRRIALVNLRLCFPQWSEAERRRVARRHFQALSRSVLERGILWWGSRERIQRLVRVEGLQNWEAVRDRPVLWLAPHFIGLDMGGARIITEWPGCSMYRHQKDPVIDRMLLRGRTRFAEFGLVVGGRGTSSACLDEPVVLGRKGSGREPPRAHDYEGTTCLGGPIGSAACPAVDL